MRAEPRWTSTNGSGEHCLGVRSWGWTVTVMFSCQLVAEVCTLPAWLWPRWVARLEGTLELVPGVSIRGVRLDLTTVWRSSLSRLR